MKSHLLLQFVLLVLLQELSFTNNCVCKEKMTQTECALNLICNLSTSCGINVCQDQTTQSACDSIKGCVWGTSCSDFTKCADYKVTQPTDCPNNSNCQASSIANTDGTFTCEDIALACSNFTSQATCQGMQADGKVCYWNTKCTAQSTTTCTEITEAIFCLTKGCKWTTTCVVEVCEDITTKSACDSKNSCAWGTSCAKFTQCSDYKVTRSYDCMSKGPCQPGNVNFNGWTCQDNILACSAITKEGICQGMQADGKVCHWNTKCIAQSLDSCSEVTDSKFCVSRGCIWTTTCTAPTCADATEQHLCYQVRGDKYSTHKLCEWVQGKCAPYSYRILTSNLCNTPSKSTCVACTGSTVQNSNYSGVLRHIVLVIAFLF